VQNSIIIKLIMFHSSDIGKDENWRWAVLDTSGSK